MSRRFPTIKQVEKIDPELAHVMREIRRLKAEPRRRLIQAALEYGAVVNRVDGRPAYSFMSKEATNLLASAAGYYQFKHRQKDRK